MIAIRNKMAAKQEAKDSNDMLDKYPLVQDFMNKWHSRSPISPPGPSVTSLAPKSDINVLKPSTTSGAGDATDSNLPTDAKDWTAIVGNPVCFLNFISRTKSLLNT